MTPSRPRAWDALNHVYAENGIVLVLGAGVSFGCGLPAWDGLLGRVAELCGIPSGENAVAEMQKAGFSFPAIASMLKFSYTGRRPFPEIVRQALYQKFPERLHRVHDGNWGDLVPFVQQTNPTLRAVAALCAVTDGSNHYRKNPKVHAIVNFNIDAVLRTYVHARYGPRPIIRTVERSSKSSDPKKISVYYMHGYVRFDAKAQDPDKEAADKLVLTEQQYYDFFNSPTSLFNHTFLYLLREHSCLFIGLSMRDDNIRRLLHYSAAERARAYADEGDDESSQEKVVRHFAIIPQPRADLVGPMERSLQPLGVRVLWAADPKTLPEGIPERLGAMYSSAGDDWNSVYRSV